MTFLGSYFFVGRLLEYSVSLEMFPAVYCMETSKFASIQPSH